MCRWMAYSGSPVMVEDLLFKPKHSLIDQSLHSSVEPAWNDRNLRDLARHISSGMVFAHVRASSGGAIQQTNRIRSATRTGCGCTMV